MKTTSHCIHRAKYRDQVYGCWCGKAIGGTLGGPYEWDMRFNHVEKYPDSIHGLGLPNDDLDLQLVWLFAVEKNGALNINGRILAEYWNDFITGPWSEYGVCRNNIRIGLMPPLSGSCGNEYWKWSNGAWIRSEIWACLFPGMPEYAVRAAYADASCDHCGEGIYAELFTAALESAAFVESDLNKLISIGLSFLPPDCRVAQTIRFAQECYRKNLTLEDARNKIVEQVSDIGWFQAPGNIGFLLLGLLYGEGDFGKSVVSAVNCGDDADCTGGTAGAILGIIHGRSGIPAEWLEPIGDGIQTCAIDNRCRFCPGGVPQNMMDLTERVVRCAELASVQAPELMRFTDDASAVPQGGLVVTDAQKQANARFLEEQDPYELTFDLPWGFFAVKFENGPYIESGKPLKMTLRAKMNTCELAMLSVRFSVPETWSCENVVFCPRESRVSAALLPGEITEPITYVQAEIIRNDRRLPYRVVFPLLRKDAVHFNDRDVTMMMDHFRAF